MKLLEMDDTVLYFLASFIVALIIGIATYIQKNRSKDEPEEPQEAEQRDNRQQRQPLVRRAQVARNARGARQRHNVRQQQVQRQPSESDDGEVQSDSDEGSPQEEGPKSMFNENRVGAKKLAKLEAKAERKAAREAEQEDRERRKAAEKKEDERRKKEDEKWKLEEKQRKEQEEKEKEEQARKEEEEYRKLVESFTIDEEGCEDIREEGEETSLLQEFISFVQRNKVVLLEDLAAQFKLKTQEAIDRLQHLVAEGQLTGVIDDRGKFIYISQQELEAVAKYIKREGRVSLTELVENSNKLINLVPETA